MYVREEIKIIGVDCPTCVYSIRRSIQRKALNVKLDVDVSTGNAYVEYDPSETSLAEIVEAIRNAGYDVEKNVLKIYVNARESEAKYLEEKLKKLKGIIDAHISPVDGLALIEYNPYSLSTNKLHEEINKLGYKIISEESVRVRKELLNIFMRRILAFVFAFIVIIMHFTMVFEDILGIYTTEIIKTFLTITVFFLSYDIIYTGMRSLLRMSPTMNSLIALSAITTFTYSIVSLAYSLHTKNPNPVSFYESSAGVLGFMSLGKYIEERIEKRAFSKLEELAKRLEGRIRVLRGKEWIETNVDEVKPGDLVEIRSGEKILVDGIIVEGEGYIDESIFTGEPEPRLKKGVNRDPVFAGSILVNGYLIVRATRVGEDTLLSKILGIARAAQFIKPRFQRIADRIVGYLTWVVIALALTTFTYWFLVRGVELGLALLFTTAVLAVTCPCPLGIAIPLVVAISVIKSMDIGLLVKRGDLFEKIREANVVFFDKTGTLTYGSFTVVDTVSIDNDEHTLLLYTCIAEKRSEHLIGRAMISYCKEKNIDPPDPDSFIPLPGLGILAEYKGHKIIVGSHNLMREMQVDIPVDKIDFEKKSIAGKTVYVALDGKFIGYIVIGDKLREESRKVVDMLRKRGYLTGILTGDTEIIASAVAEKLGIERVWFDLRPEEKAKIVDEYQGRGYKVIYVGDGVNDAIAMAKSFIGIAMGSGADILRETGDAVIVNNKLSTLIDLLELSKATRRKFVENLGWAFIYNSTLIPVAMGLFYDSLKIMLRPEYAALAMIFSDISVVINSILLLRWRRKTVSD